MMKGLALTVASALLILGYFVVRAVLNAIP